MIWLKLLTIWLSIDVVVIATYWYASTVIMFQFPNWWKWIICDYGPEIEPELDEVALSFSMTPLYPDTHLEELSQYETSLKKPSLHMTYYFADGPSGGVVINWNCCE
jgi:hypothetical protein